LSDYILSLINTESKNSYVEKENIITYKLFYEKRNNWHFNVKKKKKNILFRVIFSLLKNFENDKDTIRKKFVKNYKSIDLFIYTLKVT